MIKFSLLDILTPAENSFETVKSISGCITLIFHCDKMGCSLKLGRTCFEGDLQERRPKIATRPIIDQ